MNKLVFNNQGKAHYQKKENGQIIDVEVMDTSKYYGPGLWTAFHCIAFYSRTKEDQLSAVYAIKLMCRKFPCGTCRNHAKEYLKEHPIEKYIGVKTKDGEKLGLFIWTWKFHNAVNHRLDKPIISYEMAYEMYKNIDKDEENAEGLGSSCGSCSEKADESKAKKYQYKKNSEEPYFLTEAKSKKHEHKSKRKN